MIIELDEREARAKEERAMIQRKEEEATIHATILQYATECKD